VNLKDDLLVQSKKWSEIMKISTFFIIIAALISTVDSKDLLAPGETWTYTAQYTMKDTDICSDIVNNATVNAVDPCSKKIGPAKDGVTVHTKYNDDILFDKISDKSGEEVDAGDTINYTYYVENIGDVNLTVVSLFDDMITHVQYISGDENGDRLLNPGEVWTYEGIFHVEEDDLCFNIVNTAVLIATDPCNISRKWRDTEVVKTTCIERMGCQDRNNKEWIESGKQTALGLGNGNAANNVKIVSSQM
jgi:uncharacterized repeat protein (TIGR01451 family)